MSGRTATVFTHKRPNDVAGGLAALRRVAAEAGWRLRFDSDETKRHGIAGTNGMVADATIMPDVDLCLVLGGDGTILHALRSYAGTRVPIFAVNYGAVGFLATVDERHVEHGLRRAFAGEYETMSLPGLELRHRDQAWLGINDLSFHRKQGLRVADLAYAVGDEVVGRVRCDGLVVATPAGSTGYNLANGGPVMAWGVEGFVVSFIAPHSLTARALVVAPDDALTVDSRSREEPLDISVDGRPVAELEPGEAVEIRFRHDQACLARMPDASFYHRLAEKFGGLSQ